jgi:hypothetical protein
MTRCPPCRKEVRNGSRQMHDVWRHVAGAGALIEELKRVQRS